MSLCLVSLCLVSLCFVSLCVMSLFVSVNFCWLANLICSRINYHRNRFYYTGLQLNYIIVWKFSIYMKDFQFSKLWWKSRTFLNKNCMNFNYKHYLITTILDWLLILGSTSTSLPSLNNGSWALKPLLGWTMIELWVVKALHTKHSLRN
jgi:hypothetical protein